MTLSTSSPQLVACTVTNATLTMAGWMSSLSATNVLLGTNGVLTCAGPFLNSEMSNRVHVVCDDLVIEPSAAINVTGRGYSGGIGNATGHGPGGGSGANYDGGGGGHGGRGGSGTYTASPGRPYGSSTAPLVPGSGGGGNNAGNGEAGGGAVRIEAADQVVLNGTIAADGGGTDQRHGCGSGGSIYITCVRFAGSTGVMQADGGSADAASYENPGGGAGGRIAIHYNSGVQSSEPAVSVSFSAAAGDHTKGTSYRGELGSLWFTDDAFLDADLGNLEGRLHSPTSLTRTSLSLSDRWFGVADGVDVTLSGDVLLSTGARLDMGGSWYAYVAGIYYRVSVTSPPALHVGGNLTLTNGAALYSYGAPTNATWPEHGALVDVSGQMTLTPGARLYLSSHPSNGGSAEFRMLDLGIATNVIVTADERGFPRGSATGGESGKWGYGTGGGYYRGGAGYGGAGYAYDSQGGLTYGDSNAPVHPGSGGGSYGSYGKGGNGAGAIRMMATRNITLSPGATLTADGGTGSWDNTNPDRNGGGGSGGSVYLRCRTFRAGTGVAISADGGDAARYSGGGGGGGRIAIWRTFDQLSGSMDLTANGGLGRSALAWHAPYDGVDGTIVWGYIPPTGTIFTVR
jgi:hypothetical protein